MVLTKIRDLFAFFIGKLSIIAAVVVFFLACLTTVDVILRKISPYNIHGSFELTEMGMVVTVWIAISYFMIFKGHIRVTVFIEMMPKKLLLFWEIFAHVVGVVIVAIMVYAGIDRVQADIRRDLRSTVLLIPQFPFAIIMVIGEILFLSLFVIDTAICVRNFILAWKPDKEPQVQAKTLSR